MENKICISDIFHNIVQKIKRDKKAQYILIGFIVVVILIAMFVSSNKPEETTTPTVSQTDQVSLYVYDLENRLSNTLSKVKGVGSVSVVITVESGKETVLAMTTTTKDTLNGKEVEQTPVVINGKTVVVKENNPKITGVLIVAKGADSIAVMTKIQQATMSLLNIDLCQIEILTMK